MYYTIAELPEVPNIMEFSSLVHINNARDMVFNMLAFFFFKNKLFCALQKPQLRGRICWDIQIKPMQCPRLDLSLAMNSVALHMHHFLPDSSELSPAS